MHAFVTGGTGFVGANLVRALAAEGAAVRVLVRPGSDRSGLEGLPVETIACDLLDRHRLAGLLRGCDACFHVAALYASSDAEELRRVNVEGTRAVVEAAAESGVRAIVHTSTVGTLSRVDGSSATEVDSRLPPGASEYVRSKFRSEEVASEVAARGAPVAIVHISAPVGAWDRVPTVTGRRIVEVLRGRWPRYIRGEINHVAVRDVAAGMVLAARRLMAGAGRHRRYLLARLEGNLTRRRFTELVSAAAGMEAPHRGWRQALREAVSRRQGEPASLACDPTWTVRELGLPQTPLMDAFREAVDWFRGSMASSGR